ncbi:MAG: ribosome biogenesis GTPase Der [Rhodospirillales bacterium]|nr:ribosome biogenesis GTPase Der [Rhodospirillales bacterium]
MNLTVAIVGRPNVGKSTLFNRLVGRRVAIVDDRPGVTRDRREGEARLGDLHFTVIDTAGLDEAYDGSLEARMRTQTEHAIDGADAALLLIDARAGITPMDEYFAKWLRARETPIILIASKCESEAAKAGLYEAFRLGLGEPLALSAEHGQGMGELLDALKPLASPALTGEPSGETGQSTLQMAIVGRPNVGKSTLVNRLLGEERMLTGPEQGITRDAVDGQWVCQGRTIRLIDTAGLRRKARVKDRVEGLSAGSSYRAIQFAQLVVLVLDGQQLLEKQDLTIARQVIEEGRVLILAVNKWDITPDRNGAMGRLRDRMETSLPQARGLPVLTLSAQTGKGVNKLLPTALASFEDWNRRLPTAELNRWLDEMTLRHPPPMSAGRRLKLRYMTQAKTRPPTFVLFASKGQELPAAYQRYLVNALRDDFKLPGIPIRFLVRTGKNPYAPD